MDSKGLFSALSFVAVFIYVYVGIFTFRQSKNSKIHRMFLALCFSYGIWSFAYAFAYVSIDKYVFMYWNKIAAIGWCSFSAITLYLVLLITDNNLSRKKPIIGLVFSPAVFFFVLAVFFFGEGIKTTKLLSKIFYIGDFLYNFTFLLLSIIILLLWGLKSNKDRVKRQAKILVLCSSVPFILNLLTQTILPIFGILKFPLMGQLYSVIMILGTFVVITKYKFLRIPEKFLLEEIENKMMDMVVFTDENYEIVRISKHTLDLLGFQESELIHSPISLLFEEENKKRLPLDKLSWQEVKIFDIEIKGKGSQRIPTNISYIPVFDKTIGDFLGVVLVMQDITNEYELRERNALLHEKTIRDSLTKLYNHQYSMEIIKNEIQRQTEQGINELSLMMIDIDYFKQVNDTHGHVFGDQVLETVAGIMMASVGEKGSVGRFGGEEFIVILPEISLEKSVEIGEIIRKNIDQYEFENNLKLTVSIGIKKRRNEESVELVKKADDLLYISKRKGRNKIEYS